MLIVGLLVLLFTSCKVYQFFGNPYIRLGLIGTKYIDKNSENTDSYYAENNKFVIEQLNKAYQEDIYLVRKYRHSEYVWSVGYGGSISRVEDFYKLGIASKDKKIIVPLKYESIFIDIDYKTNKTYLKCIPFTSKKDEPIAVYKIKQGEFILLEDYEL